MQRQRELDSLQNSQLCCVSATEAHWLDVRTCDDAALRFDFVPHG